jgi:GNAT superfamily N-acetyltransferase
MRPFLCCIFLGVSIVGFWSSKCPCVSLESQAILLSQLAATEKSWRFAETGDEAMDITLRAATPGDAPECGRVLYEAFKSLADHHNFPRDFPSADVAGGLLGMLIGHPGFYGVVAERAAKVLGSNFMDERSPVLGIGPISVDPATQNSGVGRRLMQDALDRAATRGAPGVRLLQAAYHNRSLCLYTSLGFQTREPLSVMQGPPLGLSFTGYQVRRAQLADLAACNALCRDIHGFERAGELRDAIGQDTATVVEHLGAISGYATLVGFFGHAVARTNRDLMVLIATASEFPGPGFILPTRNHQVFAWCLASGLKLVMQMTLMTIGLYNQPAGAYLPSVLY